MIPCSVQELFGGCLHAMGLRAFNRTYQYHLRMLVRKQTRGPEG